MTEAEALALIVGSLKSIDALLWGINVALWLIVGFLIMTWRPRTR